MNRLELFEEIQLLEKYLSETKNGYVFFRIGGSWDDIEYRNTARFKELEMPFKFIDSIEKKTRKDLLFELNAKNKEYKITSKNHIFTEKIDKGKDKIIIALFIIVGILIIYIIINEIMYKKESKK